MLTGANKTQLLYAHNELSTTRFPMRFEKTERSRPVEHDVERLRCTTLDNDAGPCEAA